MTWRMASALVCRLDTSASFMGMGSWPSTPRWPTMDGTERQMSLMPR